MTNLYTGTIDTEGQYQTLASLTGLTFENNKKYSIQIQNSAWIREGETGEGFYINSIAPIIYTKKENSLYIKTNSYCIVNIADYVENSGGGGGSTTASRKLGEMIISPLPLSDNKIHLLDGALLTNTDYPDFINFVGQSYTNTEVSYHYNTEDVGTVTKNNGVASGFSASNYLKMTELFQPSTNTFEIVFKLKIPTTTNFAIFFGTSSTLDCQGIVLAIENYKLDYFLSSNGTSWNIGMAVGNTTFEPDSYVYIKAEFTGSAYNFYSSQDGETWTTEGTTSSSNRIYSSSHSFAIGNSPHGNSYYPSDIDLTESYININNQRWWTGAFSFKEHFTDETTWQSNVTSYGLCGDFVYDDANNTVRLPKLGNILYTSENTTESYRAKTNYYITVKEN